MATSLTPILFALIPTHLFYRISDYMTYDNAGYIDIHQNTWKCMYCNGTYSTTLFLNEAISGHDHNLHHLQIPSSQHPHSCTVIQEHAKNHTTAWGHMEPLFLYVAFNAIHDTLSVPGSFEVNIEYVVITSTSTWSQ